MKASAILERNAQGLPVIHYSSLSYEQWKDLNRLMTVNWNDCFTRLRAEAKAHVSETDPIRRIMSVEVYGEPLDAFIRALEKELSIPIN